jgi:arylsulfatase A-like enzyme
MPVRNAICITIDGLRASAFGAYGNTWHPTPALDALASQSQVFDWMLCDRPTLTGFFASAWLGSGRPLAERLSAMGVKAALATDDAWVAERAEAGGFGEIRRIEFASGQAAADIGETELAQLFAVAVDQLENWNSGAESIDDSNASRLLWLHARGYHGAWDAPLELRQSLLDEDDPPAPTFLTPPGLLTTTDHDTLLVHRAAYAAQTMVLDECMDALLAALTAYGLDDSTLVVLSGCRGYALGEHGAVGSDAASLYSELMHVPCVVRAPGNMGPPPRSSLLVQPVDLHATLLEWFGATESAPSEQAMSLLASASSMPSRGREFVVATGDDGGRVLRTPAWMLYQRRPADSPLADQRGATGLELYVKPDDRWEANEIADRLPDVAERLLAVLERTTAAATEGSPASVERLVERLDDDLIAHAR